MSTAKAALYKLAEELRDMDGGEENDNFNSPVDALVRSTSDHSDSSDSESEVDENMKAKELFNLSLTELGF